MNFSFPFTERQKRMVEHPARILWIGTATKTGKSAASYCWLIDGLLHGQACGYVGAWFFRSRRALDECKVLLEPWIRARQVRVNEARLQITAAGGGYIDFASADNPNALFGGNYDRLILDESSRMPEAIHGAALTTVSATGGRLRCLFNLELGQRNWSIRNLLRVQRLSPDERTQCSEDFLTFPTDPELVDPALVETLRAQMPLPLWEALYLGKIPDSDCSLFRNLDKIFVGQELEGPLDGTQYFLAADVARKKDWSVLTVIDEYGRVVATDRFHQISWSLQVERAALWYRTFQCAKVIVDATGVGDVVAEEFEKAGMNVEAFVFTVPSRRSLIEELVLACDNREIVLPATEKFKVYRSELESMEYQLDGSSTKYAVPSGSHDDALFSLALATHVYRASRGWVLGVLDLMKRRAKEIGEGIRDAFGELIHKPAPKLIPVQVRKAATAATETRVEGFEQWLRTGKAPACTACGSPATAYNELRKVRCNQCGGVDGVVASSQFGCAPGCPGFLKQIVAGREKCGNCGSYITPAPAVIGMSRTEFVRSRSGYGRFG